MSHAMQKLGRYLIVGDIARGGMAHIYRAKLIGVAGFEKDVAIKKILPYWSHQEDFVRMLINEAKILVHLQHKNIVQVIELGKEKDAYFIVMEYVPGLDLRKLLKTLNSKNIKIPAPLATYIIKEVCSALEFAHHQTDNQDLDLDIVHRDISPQNILVNLQGEVKITDFGIAKVKGKTKETATGVLKGKFSYMSPEQAMGSKVDLRTDLFALALVFHELLTGEKCFSGNNDLEILEKVKHGNIPIPSNFSAGTQKLFRKALEKNAFHRFQSAAEFKEALNEIELENNGTCSSKDFQNFITEHLNSEIKNFTHKEKDIVKQTEVYFAITESEQGLTEVTKPAVCEQQTRIIKQEPGDSKTVILDATIVEVPKTEMTNIATIIDKTTLQQRPKIKTSQKPYTSFFHALGISLCSSLLLLVLQWPHTNPEVTTSISSFPLVEISWFKPEPPKNMALEEKALTTLNPKLASPEPYGKLLSEVIITTLPRDSTIKITQGQNKTTHKGQYVIQNEWDEKEKVFEISTESTKHYKKNIEFKISSQQLIHHHNLTLSKVTYGNVKVTARPWGTVKIKNVSPSHTAPKFFEAIPTGKQIVTVYFPPQKRSVSRVITVAEGRTTTCKASFGNKKRYLICH